MRIGLIGDNSLEFIKILLQIWRDGNCAVIIDWRMPMNKTVELLIEAGVEYCYIDGILLQESIYCEGMPFNFIPYTKNGEVVTLVPTELMDGYRSEYNDAEAIILYSSGTTGKSKGVILSYNAINTNADAILKYMKLNQNDSVYIVKTLSHSSTIVGELIVALKAKCELYVSATIVPPKFVLDNIDRFKITTFCVNPSLLSLYCKSEKVKRHEFSSLKAIYVSGSLLTQIQINDAKLAFKSANLLNVYGLTEAGPRVTAQTISGNNVDGSVGKPIDGVKIKIVPRDNLSDEKYGVIMVKTPSVFYGYVSGSEASVKVNEDGWLNTGDIGYINDNNDLVVIGRYDNMMSIGSHNVFPEDIEFIIKKSGLVEDCVSCQNVNKQLYDYCFKNLAPYEVPKEFIKTDKIECTYNGKKRRAVYGS